MFENTLLGEPLTDSAETGRLTGRSTFYQRISMKGTSRCSSACFILFFLIFFPPLWAKLFLNLTKIFFPCRSIILMVLSKIDVSQKKKKKKDSLRVKSRSACCQTVLHLSSMRLLCHAPDIWQWSLRKRMVD